MALFFYAALPKSKEKEKRIIPLLNRSQGDVCTRFGRGKMKKSIREILNNLSDDAPKSEIYAAHYLGKISGQILNLRMQSGLSQEEFAKKLGINQSMLSKYESGEYNFTVKKLADICCKLDIDLTLNLNSHGVHEESLRKNWEYPVYNQKRKMIKYNVFEVQNE